MLIKFIIAFCLLIISSLIINAENEKNEVCYLQITCENIPQSEIQKVYLKLGVGLSCKYFEYLFVDTTNFLGIYERLKTDTTYLFKIKRRISKYYKNKIIIDSNCIDTVFLSFQPNGRKPIDDYFVFKANDTIKKIFNKYEFLPIEIFDFFKGKNE
jgi:hypothetical protein